MIAVFGRQGELDVIERFLDGLAGEGSRLVLLSGQAGIGKTTLWNAGIQSANDRGYRVVTARPTEVETGLAFAALGDLRPTARPANAGSARPATRSARRRPAAGLGGIATAATRCLVGRAQRPSYRGHQGTGRRRHRRRPMARRGVSARARLHDPPPRWRPRRVPHGAPCGDNARATPRLARLDPGGSAHAA